MLLVDARKDKDDSCTDLLELDKAICKLAKENMELLKKLEQICSKLKIFKDEKKCILRENLKEIPVLKQFFSYCFFLNNIL